jgi:hypothetical protein
MEDMLDGREDGSNEKGATVTKANDFTMSTILLISGRVGGSELTPPGGQWRQQVQGWSWSQYP